MAERRQLLILDLDETLVHASDTPYPNAPPPDFDVFSYQVWKRPHVDTFLATVLDWFAVGIWTASSESYAEAVVSQLLADPGRLAFVWARRRCTYRLNRERSFYYWIKNLSKVTRATGYPLERILMVDDSPEKLERHYGNLVAVTPFEGQRDDRELLDLLPYLASLRGVENVRTVEKRSWRSRHTHEET